jgi:hypothetical protein
MSKMYKCTEAVYHYQDGRAPVFVAQKGDEIAWDLAERLGLVKAEAKARKVADVENKAVRPAQAQSKRVVKE